MDLQYRYSQFHGVNPFPIVYGKPPPNIPLYILGITNVEAVKTRYEILEI